MADQTLAKGLRATFLGTAQKDPSAERSVKNGNVDIVYLTPERLFTETGTIQQPFPDLIKQQRIGLIAVDEAHLVWSWSSFRCGHICIHVCLTCMCVTHTASFFVNTGISTPTSQTSTSTFSIVQ